METRVYHIGVMVEALNGYGTKILDGFSRYVQQKPNWRIALFDRERKELRELLGSWEGDAILCTLVDQSFYDAAARRDIPIVNVSGLINDTDIPSVVSDDLAVGRMAAEHLLDLGFQNFAYVRRSDGTSYAQARSEGFNQRLQEAGMKSVEIDLSSNKPDDELLEALKSLPRPLGVFTALDRIAPMVIEACRKMDLKVPEEIAIIGAGNHKQLCDLCSPTLSSVELDMERRGSEAAALIDRLLTGDPNPAQPIRIPPAFVEHRRSTDIYAFDDPDVVKALRFIRENAHNTIKVRGVVAATSISRRSLEGRFNTLIGRTLHEEIWRVHLELAKRLLSSSDLSLQEVAEKSGFRTASALVNYFRLRFNVTPREFRVANRI